MTSESSAAQSRKQALKKECIGLKKQVHALKITSRSPPAPLPMVLAVGLESPFDCRIDIPYLVVGLVIESFVLQDPASTCTVALEKESNPQLPSDLRAAIALKIQAEWHKILAGCVGSDSWGLETLAAWTMQNFSSIVSCLPTALEAYMGEGANGESVRRWAVASFKEDEAVDEQDESDASYADSQDSDDEAREYWRRRREEEELEEARRKAKEAEERRQEYENDPALHAKIKKLSLKEQQELKEAKNKQGVRLAKTGPKRKKFAGEGSAQEKEQGKRKPKDKD
ncbi:hypothetical protein HDV03_001736 [Kappamyces sp. JEL0829]|nr:hypothetical protein HDV03_001736 [Kappamyces sp. JEL0829]